MKQAPMFLKEGATRASSGAAGASGTGAAVIDTVEDSATAQNENTARMFFFLVSFTMNHREVKDKIEPT